MLAANDNIAGAVVADLKAKGAQAAAALRSGRERPGSRRTVISGWQSGTVYKYVPDEADAAAEAAVALLKGKQPKTNGTRPNGKHQTDPSTPVVWITKANWNASSRTAS